MLCHLAVVVDLVLTPVSYRYADAIASILISALIVRIGARVVG
jgi:divalent metal cation (Fe/Co/Zn/Cd) transporter